MYASISFGVRIFAMCGAPDNQRYLSNAKYGIELPTSRNTTRNSFNNSCKPRFRYPTTFDEAFQDLSSILQPTKIVRGQIVAVRSNMIKSYLIYLFMWFLHWLRHMAVKQLHDVAEH